MENWKDIIGYEGYYQVSDQGRVKSLDRVIVIKDDRRCYKRHLKERILKPGLSEYGYLCCGLFKNGEGRLFRVNRLVFIAFLCNPKNKPEVNHKDGNKQNNKVSNLEWMTSSENMKDAFRSGLIVRKKGKENVCAKAVIQIDKLGNVIKKFDCIMDAARELKIFHGNIVNVCKCKYGYKTAGGYIWVYA